MSQLQHGFLAAAVLLTGCGASQGSADAGPGDVRNSRYCEVLVGFLSGSAVNIDVYSTVGLNDCPENQWSTITTDEVTGEFAADVVILNGPRYWTIDGFGDSMLLNTTPTMIGGLEMRQAGAIATQLSEVSAMEAPYALHTITRNSEFIWHTGQPVFQLVAPSGDVYTMQSYSLQKEPQQTIDSLAGLGAMLTLPAGWTFRTMTLTAEIDAKATNEMATVTQDNYDNTYLQTE
jgi:hypothetical protein